MAQVTEELTLDPVDNERLANLCGQFDQHLKQIEGRLGVQINARGSVFQLVGEKTILGQTRRLLLELYRATETIVLTPHEINLSLQQSGVEERVEAADELADEVVIKTRRGVIRGRGANQKAYLKRLQSNDINFGVGPAGTGKTYLAVASAVQALEQQKVQRLILVRPAVEAGERLGFLPGDMAQKIDPYLRPLYDALYEMLGVEQVGRLIERHVIEVAPLAFMRGRSLNDAFIILDEGQNTSMDQMKMFLTRIGFGSTAVVTGDVTQVDLPRGQTSGLRHATQVLKGVSDISFTFFTARDVVRHPLVQRVVHAYDAFENKTKSDEANAKSAQ